MSPPSALIIGCGALARELLALTRDLPGVEVEMLPALLHNRPERIPDAVRARIHEARAAGVERILVGYADCGTGGLLDRVCEEEGVERLPGAHCYEFYAGSRAFAALHDEEPGTFYLTDFLVRAFDGMVWRGLGLDRHPQLRDAYFGNYRRLVYLAQAPDKALIAQARAAADRLGLEFELRETGLGELAPAVGAFASARRAPDRPVRPPVRPNGAPGDPTSTDPIVDVRRQHRRPNRRRQSVASALQAHTESAGEGR